MRPFIREVIWHYEDITFPVAEVEMGLGEALGIAVRPEAVEAIRRVQGTAAIAHIVPAILSQLFDLCPSRPLVITLPHLDLSPGLPELRPLSCRSDYSPLSVLYPNASAVIVVGRSRYVMEFPFLPGPASHRPLSRAIFGPRLMAIRSNEKNNCTSLAVKIYIFDIYILSFRLGIENKSWRIQRRDGCLNLLPGGSLPCFPPV